MTWSSGDGPLARYAVAATLSGRGPLPSAQDALDKEAWRLLHAQAKKVETSGDAVGHAHLRASERPDAQIVALAEEIGARLIVMGSRGLGGMRRLVLGSVSDSVARHASCPVLIVREDKQRRLGDYQTKRKSRSEHFLHDSTFKCRSKCRGLRRRGVFPGAELQVARA